MVLLVTESSMLTDHVKTLNCLEWFSSNVKTKSGGWKLMLRPNVKHFLRQTASKSEPDIKKGLLDILVLLNSLQPCFTKVSAHSDSDYESLSDDDDTVHPSKIISPSSLAGYEDAPDVDKTTIETRERLLVEYFAGWAVQNARRFRRFVAITTLAPEDVANCHHIEIFSPKSFLTVTSKTLTIKPQ
jgi:hypothetical protein